MFTAVDKARLERTRELLRGEQLHKLKFADAFRDTLSMMALMLDMTRSFSSPAEYKRITNYCGSLPEFKKLDATTKKKATRRRA